MKKLIAALAALTIVAGAMPFEGSFVPEYSLTASAEEFTIVTDGSYKFYVYSDHAEVFNNELYIEEYIIPAEINGIPVTRIGNGAFSENDSIISVVIPDSVTSIGYQAFYSSMNIESITIPDSVVITSAIKYRYFILT